MIEIAKGELVFLLLLVFMLGLLVPIMVMLSIKLREISRTMRNLASKMKETK